MIAFKCISALAMLSIACAENSHQYSGAYNPGQYNTAYSGNLGGAHNPIPRYIALHDQNINNGDGTYSYSYETDNGISAHESGAPRAAGPEGLAVTAEGGYSFTAPNGEKVSLAYTADENGFQPTGSHIPTPPPIPEAILRSLEFNRQHPSSEGSYNDGRNYNRNY